MNCYLIMLARDCRPQAFVTPTRSSLIDADSVVVSNCFVVALSLYLVSLWMKCIEILG